MSRTTTVIGVDPGRTTGIAVLAVDTYSYPARMYHATVYQCGSEAGALFLIDVLVCTAQNNGHEVLIAIEKWTARQVAQSVRTGDRHTAAEFLRELALHSPRITRGRGDGSIGVVERSAANVKPWATDARLIASGAHFAGMPHGRDALRHALYAAVKELGAVDPISRKVAR